MNATTSAAVPTSPAAGVLPVRCFVAGCRRRPEWCLTSDGSPAGFSAGVCGLHHCTFAPAALTFAARVLEGLEPSSCSYAWQPLEALEELPDGSFRSIPVGLPL